MSSDGEVPYDEPHVRDVLETRRHEVAADLERRRERIREHGSQPVTSESEDINPCDLDPSLVELNSAMLRRIDIALRRLGDGSYGRCTRCGEMIADARLRAMPFALRCRPCESVRERKTRDARTAARSRLWVEGPIRTKDFHEASGGDR